MIVKKDDSAFKLELLLVLSELSSLAALYNLVGATQSELDECRAELEKERANHQKTAAAAGAVTVPRDASLEDVAGRLSSLLASNHSDMTAIQQQLSALSPRGAGSGETGANNNNTRDNKAHHTAAAPAGTDITKLIATNATTDKIAAAAAAAEVESARELAAAREERDRLRAALRDAEMELQVGSGRTMPFLVVLSSFSFY